MNSFIVKILALFFLLGASAHAQAPLPAGASVLAQLQAMQAANRALLEKQQKTLETLDEMKSIAEQLKTMGKRG